MFPLVILIYMVTLSLHSYSLHKHYFKFSTCDMDGNPPELLSPEFEFWRVKDRSSTQPNVNLISADELFYDGILLPLHFLNLKPDPDPLPSASDPSVSLVPVADTVTGPDLTRGTASKHWSGLFGKSEKKPPAKNRKREKKTGSGSGLGSAELNINIWPFSRSRSAGNTLTRPRMLFGAPTTRKISSAPCSRSNSAGESKSRKWPNSPRRGGVQLGRSSPVWQVRRGDPTSRVGKKEIGEVRRGKTVNEQNKPKVLNLNVPAYTGYRSRLICRNDSSGNSSNVTAATVSANSLFGFRNLFIKKVY